MGGLILKTAEHLGISDVLWNGRTLVNLKILPETPIMKFMAFINQLFAHSHLFFNFSFYVMFS